MSKSEKRQTDLLVALVAGGEESGEVFFTVSTFDGCAVMHPGLPDGQVETDLADVHGLAERGEIRITEHRQYGDVAFVVTTVGRERAERFLRGGLSEADEQRARAERAEAALKDHLAEDERAGLAIQVRRERLANAIAWIPALVLAILLGAALFSLSESPELRFIIGILLAAGVAGSWVVAPVRRWIAARLVWLLGALHDRT